MKHRCLLSLLACDIALAAIVDNTGQYIHDDSGRYVHGNSGDYTHDVSGQYYPESSRIQAQNYTNTPVRGRNNVVNKIVNKDMEVLKEELLQPPPEGKKL